MGELVGQDPGEQISRGECIDLMSVQMALERHDVKRFHVEAWRLPERSAEYYAEGYATAYDRMG